ncbi:MAG: hypothetical protein ACO3RB_00965 [Ilumatobacteraceae bacterium]
MFQHAFRDLDRRRWFDRMHPQTLAIATWLLYIDGVFNVLAFLDRQSIWGYWRLQGGVGLPLTLLALVAYPLGGFLMANGKRLGWWIAVGAAASPWILRLVWKSTVYWDVSLEWLLVGDTYVSFMFEAALLALLVHPMSRSHAERWMR